ncbi:MULTISPECIES: TonB-dependent receptor family protein [Methylotenera]|uniref:TonB-dependent receptor family protein n=1 Tax=Methylotenera TaxID=359407 RepID=UPI00037BE44B|nr:MULTISPECIES: TonB-dependent receptor [Methylotenera]
MIKSNHLCVLSALAIGFSHTAFAEHNETIHLDEVDVSATKISPITQPNIEEAKQAINKTAGGVTIVDLDEVREGRVSNFRDTLGLATGVLAQSRFGAEETRLSIRGSGLQRTFHGRGIKLMQDGIPVNQADGGFDYQAIEPMATRYIEVYRGANALRYGASNLGGAINFISPSGYDAEKFSVRAEAGSFDYRRLGLSAGGVVGDFDYFVSGSTFNQDGFRDYATQNTERINANFGYRINSDIETRFYVGYAKSDSNLPGNLTKAQLKDDPSAAFLSTVTGQQKRDIDLIRVANKTNILIGDHSNLQLSAYFSHKDLFHPIFQVLDQDTNDYGFEARYSQEGELFGHKNEFILGVNPSFGVGYDDRWTNNLGVRGARQNKLENRSKNLEAYAENRFYILPDVSLVTGLQYTHSQRQLKDKFFSSAAQDESFDATYVQTNPKVGVLYDYRPNVQFYANVSRSYEPPSFGELTGGLTPNIVEAQDGTTFEVGTRGNSEKIDWDFSAYYAKLNNELLQTAVFAAGNNPAAATQTTNADKTIHAGIELGLTARLPWHLEWRQSLLINQFKFDNDNTFGNRDLPGLQKSLLRGELMYRNHGFYVGPTVEFSPQRYAVDFAETLYADSYTLFGMKLGQKVNEHFSWFLDARNLNDKKYAASTSVILDATRPGTNQSLFLPGDGRSVYVGAEFKY